MTSYFLDVNVWLALNDVGHAHAPRAWKWLSGLAPNPRLVFSRYTNLGLLRLLTNRAVMGPKTLTLGLASEAYARWLNDPRVRFFAEPDGVDLVFRRVTEPFRDEPASNWVGDCYVLAFAVAAGATLVTFDRALHDFALKQSCPAVLPD